MAYYGDLVSLKQTIKRLQNSSYQIWTVPQGRRILRKAYKRVGSLENFINRLEIYSGRRSNERAKALKAQIREAVRKLEDALESHVSEQFLISQSESLGDDDHEASSSSPIHISPDLTEVRQELNSFAETVEKMKKMMQEEWSNPLPEDEDDAISSRIDHFNGNKSKMVGLSGELEFIIKTLLTVWGKFLKIVSLWGMAGIGKTALAKEIYCNEFILNQYDRRVWITIGEKYQLGKVFLTDKSSKEGEEIFVEDLYKSLKGRKYLIVVDDVWKTEDWDKFKKLLPDDKNGSRVLLTTRLKEVAQVAQFAPFYGNINEMLFLDEEESWHLLREKVFGDESLCPPQLEKAGKKIAKKCEGLPLAIVAVAEILSKVERTPDYWNKVADDRKEHSVFIDAYDKISNVLYPSYKHLPDRLKACFLYMGVVSPRSEIPVSKLVNLWTAEAFLGRNTKDIAMKHLEDLISNSVVLGGEQSSRSGIKTCRIHSAILHLCVREARKERFLHVMNSYANNTLAEDIKRQRRLCILNNILFGITEVYNSIQSISRLRSLLCTGPYHQYPVPICFGLRLLRVLDALTVRFYKFPIEVLKLVQLRYLALTCNGNLPSSICKLWNLQYLIVRRHVSIINSSRASSYLPMEIWDMKELKHLQVMGSNLPRPYHSGTVLLPILLTLSDVSMHSCCKEILERISNLKKLGIQIELAPSHAVEPFWFFDLLPHLHQLESLKCVVVNPKVAEIGPPCSSISTSFLPSSLKKISLSGLGYPWEYIRIIARLPRLKVLKLRSYAFQGPEWVTFKVEFLDLEYLLLEDIDIECWRASDSDYNIFPSLRELTISNCYKLKEIPLSMGVRHSLLVNTTDCPLISEEILSSVYCLGDLYSSWEESDWKVKP